MKISVLVELTGASRPRVDISRVHSLPLTSLFTTCSPVRPSDVEARLLSFSLEVGTSEHRYSNYNYLPPLNQQLCSITLITYFIQQAKVSRSSEYLAITKKQAIYLTKHRASTFFLSAIALMVTRPRDND